MAVRTVVAATVAVTLTGCGDGGRRDDDQARLPVESQAVEAGGARDCTQPLPAARGEARPPAGTPFLAESVWFQRDATTGSDVRRAYAPAASPRLAADELLTQLRAGGFTVEGENVAEGRATVTYVASGGSVSVIVTPLCEGYVELAYHFPLTAEPS